MSQLKEFKNNVTAEHVMLVFLLVLSAVFFVEPVIQEYPDDARVFPQLTSGAVFIGVFLLLIRSYLPGPIRSFVAEEVTITSDTSDLEEDLEVEEAEQPDEAVEEEEKDTLGTDLGYKIDDTLFMVSTAVVYFFAGWVAGFFFVTPIYVLFYTLWYKVNVAKSVFLAILATVILWIFMEFLGMPFDQGNVLDFSPLLPFFVDGLSVTAPWGGR